MARGNNVFADREKDLDRLKKLAAIKKHQEEKEKFRTNWIKHNRDAYIAAGSPEDISHLVSRGGGVVSGASPGDPVSVPVTGNSDPITLREGDMPDNPAVCPHGEEPHECDACMRESDFQYDAAREDRLFR